MSLKKNDPVWVKGERMRMAATVVAVRGKDVEVRYVHGGQHATVAEKLVEPRDPRHPLNKA